MARSRASSRGRCRRSTCAPSSPSSPSPPRSWPPPRPRSSPPRANWRPPRPATARCWPEDEDQADALTGLAAILLERGDREEAEALIERAGDDRRAGALRHHIFLADFAERHDAAELEQAARLDPGDPRARYRWGVMLAAWGRYDEALDELLESVRLDRHLEGDAARKGALAVFDILGPESPLARDYRRRLTQILF